MKILIADDHALFREGLHYTLKALAKDVEILEASNGSQAIQIVRHYPDLDLVKMHRHIPGPCKVSWDGNQRFLLSEVWFDRQSDMVSVFRAAKESLSEGVLTLRRGRSKTARMLKASSTERHDRHVYEKVEDVLNDLGVSITRRGDGWAASLDTDRFLHRIRFSICGRKGTHVVRMETPGDRITCLSDVVAEAIGRFLLEANAKTRFARLSLVDAGEKEGTLLPIAEVAVPLALFEVDRVRTLLEAIIVGASRVRSELEALSREHVAQAYVRMMQTGGNGSGSTRKRR